MFQNFKISGWVGPQATGGGWARRQQASYPQVIHRLSTEKIFKCLLMGFSMKRWDYEKSKNDCSCEPTHDQVQQETRHGVSCSHCEAQRQDLLCSRGYLPPSLNYNVSSTQPAQLWGRLLGGDSRRRHSFRLDRGPSTEASVDQVGAQDGPSTRIFKVDQLGDFRVGQERRREVRYRAGSHHYPRNGEGEPCSLIKKLEASKALKNSCRIYSCMDFSFISMMIQLEKVSLKCNPILFVGDKLKFFLSAHKNGAGLNVLMVTASISLVFILEDRGQSYNLKIRKPTSHGRVGP